MKLKSLSMCLLLSGALYKVPMAQTLIHYWNFNDNSSQTALLTPQTSTVAGGTIQHVPGGSSAINVSGGTGQDFNVDNLNARNNDPAGTHLRLNDPIGGELVFSLPTTGFENPVIRFTTRRSGSGAGIQNWYYTTDGVNYTPFTTVLPVDGNPVLVSFNFTDSAGVDNNADFKIKVSFAQGGGGNVGNNRFDNFTVDAHPAGGLDVTPPVASFQPAHLSTGVSAGIHPEITFNEPVRLMNNTPLNNSNAASVIDFRLNDATGASVPFTAAVSGNTLTIIPTSTLLYNQQYYMAVLPNTIEDLSDNALQTAAGAQFTTITQQTLFNPGDLVPVAYRMNATSTEDEIALLTFVDILPGTVVHLTDAKYTANAQPQCSGGITWTAPLQECIAAGTIITIQTDALVTNKGTVSGSGFGLSSGGDQVIVYAGTAASPQYITALTSNGWVASSTTCNGSLSMIPAGLADGTSSANLSSAPGNASGNSANAYYNGTQAGTQQQLRTAILNPSNWVVSGSGTAAQAWPSYAFPSSPMIIQAYMSDFQTVKLVFNTDLDLPSASSPANYTGIPGLSSVAVTNNGAAPDTVSLVFSTPFTTGSSYTLYVDNIMNTTGVMMVCTYSWAFTYATEVSFATDFLVVEENAGTISLNLNIINPSVSSLTLEVLGAPHSTADASDFTLATQTIQLSGSGTVYSIQIPVTDDNLLEQHAEYLVLKLHSPNNCVITGDSLATIYIRDNDRPAPLPTGNIELQYIGSFDPSGNNNSTCEVVAYDVASRRLFTSSAISGFLDIIDFSNPLNPALITSVDINPYGGITSVAVHSGKVAVASPNHNEQQNGSILFFDINGTFISQVTAGALPDMVTFTPDGTKVLAANEGQPNQDYSIDPEGSVTIIDISGGMAGLTQAQAVTLDFTSFNSQETALMNSGVRKTKSTSTLSQDLEPEYITVSADGSKAWVTLQENNAIAEIDLQNTVITDIWALGTKDMSIPGNGFDASDNNGEILIANWPVKAFYIPDGIGTFQVAGVNYLVTANEGDEKEYASFEERTSVDASGYVLNPLFFPHADMLRKSHNLGRMRVTNLNGDTNQDGQYEEIYCVGSRSFSIFNADTKTLVYDSGDDFERYTAMTAAFQPVFNSDHEDNSFKKRSRAKGPEPEGVAIGALSGKTYAFIALERIGGVMVYDVTDPENAVFTDYKNSRSTSAYQGDHGAETLIFIPASQSPDLKNYLVIANEISGTLAVYEVVDHLSTGIGTGTGRAYTAFNIFPNPSKNGVTYFNRPADVIVTDVNGRVVLKGEQLQMIATDGFMPGIYTIQTADGATAKLVVK